MYRFTTRFLFGILAIEFFDEFVFSSREVLWPQLRDDLVLDYQQIGLLMALPGIGGPMLEPLLGLLADRGHRPRLILGGGFCFLLCLLLIAWGQDFTTLAVATFLIGPASGAFVSLSQTALMDAQPERREQNMARWALAGTVGMLAGPLLCVLLSALGFGWRTAFLIFALGLLPWLLNALRLPMPPAESSQDPDDPPSSMLEDLRSAFTVLRDPEVRRWMILLPMSNLMLDILLAFLTLYLVDTTAASDIEASLAVGVWVSVGLIGDILILPLLERVPGLRYLRISAWLALILYPMFLLVPSWPAKLVLLGLLGFFNAGWYSILQARFYDQLPGRSGLVMALGSLEGLFSAGLLLLVGWTAEAFGIRVAMGLLLAGPLAVLVGLPRHRAEVESA